VNDLKEADDMKEADHSLMRKERTAKEPYISTKEPYISTKEPYISTTEPYLVLQMAE